MSQTEGFQGSFLGFVSHRWNGVASIRTREDQGGADSSREHLVNEGLHLGPVWVEKIGLVAWLPLRWVKQ
jgi:hypothetical protein